MGNIISQLKLVNLIMILHYIIILWTFFLPFFYIKPEVRIGLIRNEIIRNLNEVNANKEDLYIHIRSGDIFDYAQSPYA